MCGIAGTAGFGDEGLIRAMTDVIAHRGPDGEGFFVGDGVSDRCVSLAADRVFARDGLARYLSRQGVAFEPFEDFHDVARALERL